MEHTSAAEAFERWMRSLQADALARRDRRIEGLRTPEDVAEWAEQLRAWYRRRVGPLLELEGEPRREFHGRVEREGYHVEKWLFEVMPGTFSSANLYVPGKPNDAGVALLAPMGHWAGGKALDEYQNLGGYMACNGIAVLVYDHAGVGERREFWDPVRGESRPGKTPTSEHNRTGDLATLAGIQPARFFLSEAARARDLLASFDFVRPERIGVSGASGGGTMSRFAAAYLDGLAFAIPVCIIRGPHIGGGDAEQCCWGAGTRGVAAVDLLATMVPRPVMIVTETSFEATAQSYAALRRIYDAARADASATELFAIDDRHGYTHPMIEAVYRFLARQWELGPPDPDTWQHVRLLTEQQTHVCPGGLIYRHRPQVTLQQQIRRIAPAPKGLSREGLPSLLGIADMDRAPVPYAWTGQPGEAVRVTGSTRAGEGELGLLDWKEPHPPQWYFGHDFIYKGAEADAARLLLHYDRCLVGLRVRQILDFLGDHEGRALSLAAEGHWSVPLAFAAAMAGPDLLKAATVRYLPASFRDFLDADLNSTSIGMIVPGLLAHGDIDDVVALAGERLTVPFRVDSDWRVVRPA